VACERVKPTYMQYESLEDLQLLLQPILWRDEYRLLGCDAVYFGGLLPFDSCVHINSVLETNISRPAPIIIKRCPFEKATIRKI